MIIHFIVNNISLDDQYHTFFVAKIEIIEGHNNDHTVNCDAKNNQLMVKMRMGLLEVTMFKTTVATFNSAEHSHLAEILAQWRHLLQPCDCEQ